MVHRAKETSYVGLSSLSFCLYTILPLLYILPLYASFSLEPYNAGSWSHSFTIESLSFNKSFPVTSACLKWFSLVPPCCLYETDIDLHSLTTLFPKHTLLSRNRVYRAIFSIVVDAIIVNHTNSAIARWELTSSVASSSPSPSSSPSMVSVCSSTSFLLLRLLSLCILVATIHMTLMHRNTRPGSLFLRCEVFQEVDIYLSIEIQAAS